MCTVLATCLSLLTASLSNFKILRSALAAFVLTTSSPLHLPRTSAAICWQGFSLSSLARLCFCSILVSMLHVFFLVYLASLSLLIAGLFYCLLLSVCPVPLRSLLLSFHRSFSLCLSRCFSVLCSLSASLLCGSFYSACFSLSLDYLWASLFPPILFTWGLFFQSSLAVALSTSFLPLSFCSSGQTSLSGKQATEP